ncbi:hypothetical protein F5884DRAFT_875111, partial [Xylogone sp. PMI_703]
IPNAIITSHHTSSTEAVYSWPIFSNIPVYFKSLFELENAMPPLSLRRNIRYPYLTDSEIERLVSAFQRSANSWHPTLPLSILEQVKAAARDDDWEWNTDSCLALLVLALGAETSVIEMIFSAEDDLGEVVLNLNSNEKELGRMFFDAAFKMLSVARTENTVTAAHCLHLSASIYFSYLQKPLHAWNAINATAVKCVLLLRHPSYHANAEVLEMDEPIFY